MCKCTGPCGCGTIKSPKGEKGDSGTVINYVTNNVTTVVKALIRYFQQVTGQTLDIYNTAAGQDISIITMPTIVGSAQVNIKFNCQVDATDVNNVTASIKVNGSGIGPPSRKITMPAKVGGSAKTWAVIDFPFKLSGVTTGTVIAVNVVSDGAGVTPRLLEYYWELEIIQ